MVGVFTPHGTSALPSAAADLNKLQSTINLNKPGILDIKSAADEKKGIGKGFEGQLQILSVFQPDVLTWQPGEIVKPQTGFGEAIDREYRVSQVKHSWSAGAIASTVSIYLPVAIVVKQDATPTQGGAVSGMGAIGNPDFDKWDAKWKKAAARGDVIAGTGRKVTSPFGMRKHPVTGEYKMHNGTDIDCPIRTKLYAICKPGESVTIEYLPNQAGAGNMIRYQYGEYTFQYFHLDSGGSGKYEHGQIVCFSGVSGLGSGPHTHVEIYKTQEGASKRFGIPLGYLYWVLTSNSPS
jgi:murein DD-endopeptidase MepM/ murein hydrolase activator NlpD